MRAVGVPGMEQVTFKPADSEAYVMLLEIAFGSVENVEGAA